MIRKYIEETRHGERRLDNAKKFGHKGKKEDLLGHGGIGNRIKKTVFFGHASRLAGS